MSLKELQKNWDEFGRTDPLWAILTWPGKEDNKWQIDEFFKTGTEEIDLVMRYVQSVYSISYGKALDFGCGIGRLTQALTNYFDDVYGIDIASSMIESANRYNKYEKKCHYILNEENDLRLFENDSFDFIYSNIVLQHMKPEYSKNYIKEFLRIMTPNGITVFQIPSEKKSLGQISIRNLSSIQIYRNTVHRLKYILRSSYFHKIHSNLPDSAFDAQIIVIDHPTEIEANSKITIFVKIKNISNVIWPALGDINGKYQISLGNHWLDSDEKIIINDDARVALSKDIRPSEEEELSLTVTTPGPGIYILEIDLVQEMVAWFKDKGSKTAKITMAVKHGTHKDKPSSKDIPKMEMYGIRKHEIIALIEKSGGRIIDIQENDAAGKEWRSYRYCITKDK